MRAVTVCEIDLSFPLCILSASFLLLNKIFQEPINLMGSWIFPYVGGNPCKYYELRVNKSER